MRKIIKPEPEDMTPEEKDTYLNDPKWWHCPFCKIFLSDLCFPGVTHRWVCGTVQVQIGEFYRSDCCKENAGKQSFLREKEENES